VGSERPAAGDQLYVFPLVTAVTSWMDAYLHSMMVVSVRVFIVGYGVTVTLTVSFALHWPPGLTVITYCVLVKGVANGLKAEGSDKPEGGDQL
jgi:hypothetical protein